MNTNPTPYIIDFGKIVTDDKGALSVAENKNLPFNIKRIFWAYDLPNLVTRGYHAHRETTQILIALKGIIVVSLEDAYGNTFEFKLNQANKGLVIPPNYWHTMYYESDAVQLVMASHEYSETDYLRDYKDFVKYWKK